MQEQAQRAFDATGATRPENLGGELFEHFADLIYEISGMRFTESKSYYLTSKIFNRIRVLKLGSFEEYLRFLKTAEARHDEHALLMNEVTINETFFFRNQPQLDDFEKLVLTPLLDKRREQGKQKIRIWSCASSTGDEAYTTALQLVSNPASKDFSLEIIGTDICRNALAIARTGVYGSYATRNIPHDLLQRYFSPEDSENTQVISDEIKRLVKFQECNMLDKQKVRMLGHFDIIFCRNVLIYFDNDSKEQALHNISDALADDGYLLIGHSENLYPQRHIFKQDKDKGQALAYQKSPPGTKKLDV